jgi:glyoxylase-like metal-dependent hydrolase (beta-lactamase superfamily II)
MMTVPLEMRTRQVGLYSMNAYALVCPTTKQSVLIDPGDDPDALQEMLKDTQPIAILLTHTHFDHVGALAEMRSRLPVPLMLHRGPHAEGFAAQADRWLEDGDTVQVGEHTMRVCFTPGHTADQVCYVINGDSRVFVGDTIFEGGPGKTWSVEDFRTTLETLHEVILKWDDKTICYPGHGPFFRLGDQRRAIEGFLRKEHGEFFGDATWGM